MGDNAEHLIKYIIALTNLYGLVNKDLVLEIYNTQNDEKISILDIEKQLEDPPEELEDSFIYPYKNYFVHEVILEFHEFDLMISKKTNKPHYIPNRKELINYVDEEYFEKNIQYKRLLNYMRKSFSNIPKDEIEEMAEEIYDICAFEFSIQDIFNIINRKNIEFESEEQLNEIVQIIIELANNTRLWENNGFTPDEIARKNKYSDLKQSSENTFIRKKPKIGRNDPCPCGSGKKYKKCCLSKDE